MKQYLCLIIAISLITGCANKNQCVVKGKLKGIENTFGVLQYVNYQGKLDTIKITGSSFTVNAKCTQPQLALLAFSEKVDPKDSLQAIQQKQPISFAVFLEPGKTIDIQGDVTIPDNIKFTGSNLNNEFLEFQTKTLKPVLQKEQAFMQMAQAVVARNPKAMDSLQAIYVLINNEKKDLIVNNSLKNKNSVVAATYTYLIYQSLPVDTALNQVYAAMSEGVKKSFAGLKIKEKIDQQSESNKKNGVKMGAVVPNFTLKDAKGNAIELKNKYAKSKLLLIDFWASWCKPCRSENPNIVKVYNAFKDKGFDVLGVSLDEDDNAWKEATKADGLQWTHVIDQAGWASKVVEMYGIEAIPSSFLVDANGTLIATDLRGDDLQKKIASILK